MAKKKNNSNIDSNNLIELNKVDNTENETNIDNLEDLTNDVESVLTNENIIDNDNVGNETMLINDNVVSKTETEDDSATNLNHDDLEKEAESKKTDKNEKNNFKNVFKFKNGKPIKYIEDSKFKEEMSKIAKKRGYYEDIFKTNMFN